MSRQTFFSLGWYEFFSVVSDSDDVSDAERRYVKEKSKQAWEFFKRPTLN